MGFWEDIGLVGKDEFYKVIRDLEARMGQREDAAYEKLTANIDKVKEGWAAKDAEIRVLRDQLAGAGAEKEQAVADALDADSDFDAGKIEAADAALGELTAAADAPADPAPVEENPVPVEPGTGEEPAPVDGETNPNV